MEGRKSRIGELGFFELPFSVEPETCSPRRLLDGDNEDEGANPNAVWIFAIMVRSLSTPAELAFADDF